MNNYLKQDDEAILNDASIIGTKKNVERIVKYLNNNRWLRENNRYSKDTIDHINKDVDQSCYKHKEINEYIAASIFIHCLDAWSYFGKGVITLLSGDLRIARHIFYYSELRSAMSILASQGIGVFNNKHFIITSKDRCKVINKGIYGTHRITWNAIDHWINNQNRYIAIKNIINIGDIPLFKWLESYISGSSAGTINSLFDKFLKSAGFDLSLFDKDRSARNHVSYRPSTISKTYIIDYEQVLSEIELCWSLCEPLPGSGLHKIDNILLSRLLQQSFKAKHKHNCSYKQANRQFEHSISNFLKENLSYSGSTLAQRYKNIISDKHTSRIFDYIDNYKDPSKLEFVYGMMYRNLFLLRISCALVEFHINETPSLNSEKLRFWWSQIGHNSGFWESGDASDDFYSLWEDISPELDDLNDWISMNTGTLSYKNFLATNHISPLKLANFERVCFWSIGL